MKTTIMTIVAICLVAITIWVSQEAWSNYSGSNEGTWELVAGESSLFRINTRTGETFRLRAGSSGLNGGLPSPPVWVPLVPDEKQ